MAEEEEEEEGPEREGEGGGGGGEARGWMEVMHAEGGAPPPPVPVGLEVSMEKHTSLYTQICGLLMLNETNY